MACSFCFELFFFKLNCNSIVIIKINNKDKTLGKIHLNEKKKIFYFISYEKFIKKCFFVTQVYLITDSLSVAET